MNRYLPAVLGAALLNAMLLVILTQLSRARPLRADLIDSIPVRLVQITPPEELEAPRREPPRPPEPEQRPGFTPASLQPSLARFPAPDIGVVVETRLFDPPGDMEFVFDMTDVDEQPVPVVSTPPIYPERPRRLGIEGRVLVKFLVTSNGSVQEVDIVEARPEGLFEEAVLKAVSTWRFRPGRIGGRAVSSWWYREIEFDIQ
jgi:protein TonB